MNRKVLLGCAAVLMVIVAALVIALPFVLEHATTVWEKWVNAQREEANRRSAIEQSWQPPTLPLDASWFPEKVGAWTLTGNEDTPGSPELNIDRAGQRGKYRGEKQDIEVTILPVNDLEKDGVFSRVKTALEHEGTQVTTGTKGSMSYSVERHSGHITTQTTPNRVYVSTDGHRTRLWWVKDFLFVFRTNGSEDPDVFADEFLTSMTVPVR